MAFAITSVHRSNPCCSVPSQILDIKTETPELIDSLATLSTFYNENTAGSRRALRSTIEQRSLDINEKFIAAAEGVIKVGDASASSVQHACMRACLHVSMHHVFALIAASWITMERCLAKC